MATIQVLLFEPDGTQHDITSRLTDDSLPDLSIAPDFDRGEWAAGDVAISCRDEDGVMAALWPLPLPPDLVWDEATGQGTWYVQIKKGGALRWHGDVDTPSVAFDDKQKTVSFSVLGAAKRAERHNAALVKRAVPAPLYITVEKGKRKILLWVDAARTVPLTAADANLAVGDKIRCTQLTLNGAPIDQDLEVSILGPSVPDGLTDYQVKVKGYPKKTYSQGVVANPWHRGQTVAYVVGELLDHLGIAVGSRDISGSGTALTCDEADFASKTVGEALAELAEYASAEWWEDCGTWHFVGREADKAGVSSKAIDTLLAEKTENALYDRHYLTVVAKGTKDRYNRVGKITYPNAELSIETDFTASLSTLEAIAQNAYDVWGLERAFCDVVLNDDGTIYHHKDKVTIDGEAWWVIEISEPLRAAAALMIAGAETEIRDTVTLKLLQVNGTAPDTAELDAHDDNTDYDPPYPPETVELGKGTDAAGSRPAWWSDFRTIFSNEHGEWPITKPIGTQKLDDGTKQLVFGRLWVARWQNHPDNPEPDGFEITVYKSGKDPSKPTQRHGYRNPALSAGGYYYWPWYKVISASATDKEVVVQTWDALRGFSCYSDPASTSDTEIYGAASAIATVYVGAFTGTSDPALTALGTPEEGWVFRNTTDGRLWIYHNGAWEKWTKRLRNRSTWSSSTTYDEDDVVERSGSSYISLQDSNLNHPPETSGSWWSLLSGKGDTGTPGTNGNGVYMAFHTNAPSAAPTAPADSWDGTNGGTGDNGWTMNPASSTEYNWVCQRKSSTDPNCPPAYSGPGFTPASSAWTTPVLWSGAGLPPSALVLNSLTSTEREIPGSSARRCDLAIAFTISNCTSITFKVQGPSGGIHKCSADVDGGTGTAYLDPVFKRGGTLTVLEAIAHNGKTKSTFQSIANNTCTAGGSVAPSVTDPTLTLVEKNDAAPDVYQAVFGTLNADLVKLQVCKSSGAGSPDLTRMQAPVDCLDYTQDPPACTQTQFQIDLHHAKGSHPKCWVRAVTRYGKGNWVATGSTPIALSVAVTPTGLSCAFTATPSGGSGTGYVYSWDMGGAGSYSVGGSASQNPTFVYAAEGAYQVTCTLTDSAGNTTSATILVNAFANPVQVSINNSGVWSGGTAPYTMSPAPTATASGGVGTLTYDWIWGDGSQSLNGGASPGAHQYALAGTFVGQVKVADSRGSFAVASFQVVVGTSVQQGTLAPARLAQDSYDSEFNFSTWYLDGTSGTAVPDFPASSDNSNCSAEDSSYVGNPGGLTKYSRPAYFTNLGGSWATFTPVRGIKVRVKCQAEADSKVYINSVGLVNSSNAVEQNSVKTVKAWVPATAGWVEFGHEADLWGLPPSWFTEAALESVGFGVMLQTYCKATAAAKWVKIDKVEVVIYD